MKSVIQFLVVLMLSVMASVCITFAYHHFVIKSAIGDRVTYAANEVVEDYFHPLFTSDTEAVVFYDDFVDEVATDSIFTNMPRDVLINVARVVSKQKEVFDVKDIVEEYLRHYSTVYRHLRPDNIEPVPTEIQLSDTTRATIRSEDEEDTVINGKLYKVIHQ